MKRTALLALALLALPLAGCGTSARLLASRDPRASLKKGFYTTYEFRYEVKGSPFGSRTLSNPRLLYAERDAELARRIIEALGSKSKVEHAPPAKGDAPHTLASVEKAGRELGYVPKVDIDEGLRRYLEWRTASS